MISFIKITEEAFPLYRDQIMAIEEVSFPSPWTARAFLEETRNPVSHLWALKRSEQILGYICFWMFAAEVHLLNLAVHPQWRRRGLGSRLLAKMKAVAYYGGVERIWLEVRPSNSAARKLYSKAGFREQGRRKRYYTDTGEDAIVMTLEMGAFSVPLANVCVDEEGGKLKSLG
ncbi:MAG: ribosomal-protein-alanine N-acetyltransferase [Deltaproteobacteria bacterium]|nr:MAG: ribosomal-protein-alanine N-acetyltransferase [Deltaproteobacteria bacterium]